MAYSNNYVVGFAGAICVVCSIFVAGSAVALKDKQELNATVDQQKQVLEVAGLVKKGEKLSAAQVGERFESNLNPKVIELATGEYAEDIDTSSFSTQEAMNDPNRSSEAPANEAKVQRIPQHALVYELKASEGDGIDAVILPIQGKGLWSTMKGFIALQPDGNTVAGLTFYSHGETPGLGGEVDNPKWKALWPGRKVFGEDGEPKIEVIKGQAGPVASDPYRVDGLSGATITSRGVSSTVQFWVDDQAFGPYLEKVRARAGK